MPSDDIFLLDAEPPCIIIYVQFIASNCIYPTHNELQIILVGQNQGCSGAGTRSHTSFLALHPWSEYTKLMNRCGSHFLQQILLWISLSQVR